MTRNAPARSNTASLARSAVVSWKTTAAGVFGALVILWPEIGDLLFLAGVLAEIPDISDGVVNWNLVVGTIAAAFGLTLARDGDKSSQDQGVRS
jgi:hypothetical protein